MTPGARAQFVRLAVRITTRDLIGTPVRLAEDGLLHHEEALKLAALTGLGAWRFTLEAGRVVIIDEPAFTEREVDSVRAKTRARIDADKAREAGRP